GALRGRVLAGVQGNENVRIFCSNLQAELVSIAGNYRVSEDIVESERNTPVQIYLSKHAIIIQNI
ncbi:MAG: septum site-determining protein MinC, partial [Gammaproteobacteria bacterium]|nr:septum site-determining protein MinC [Gammaproteobacteria bacterium]